MLYQVWNTTQTSRLCNNSCSHHWKRYSTQIKCLKKLMFISFNTKALKKMFKHGKIKLSKHVLHICIRNFTFSWWHRVKVPDYYQNMMSYSDVLEAGLAVLKLNGRQIFMVCLSPSKLSFWTANNTLGLGNEIIKISHKNKHIDTLWLMCVAQKHLKRIIPSFSAVLCIDEDC